jgi:hypothetical protein
MYISVFEYSRFLLSALLQISARLSVNQWSLFLLLIFALKFFNVMLSIVVLWFSQFSHALIFFYDLL